jgi:hypothetical protein
MSDHKVFMQWILYKFLNPLEEEISEHEMMTWQRTPRNEVYETHHIFDMVVYGSNQKIRRINHAKWGNRIC